MVLFRPFNLLEPLVTLGSVDVVFCRNVAIYFDMATRKQLFERIARQIKPGGYLVIGASETLHGVTDHFERREHMRSSYYVVKP
jgi:chemotaxis protein methyltransferase CheR